MPTKISEVIAMIYKKTKTILIFILLSIHTLCLSIVWKEGLTFYASVSVSHNGQGTEIYKARNTALALAQYELLEQIWNLKLNQTTTLHTWAEKNGYTKTIEGTLEKYEIVQETITASTVEITIKKTIDIEQIYKAIGKNFEPTLQKDFTGVIVIVPKNTEIYLMPEIKTENDETIVQPQIPLAIYETVLSAYESPIVGYIPVVIKALKVKEDKITIPTKNLKNNPKWQNILELMKKGKIVIAIEQ